MRLLRGAKSMHGDVRGGRELERGFTGSREYWLARYDAGRSSGAGSGGVLARYKAAVIGRQLAQWQVRDVIEFGCGDGRQLALIHYPAYLGLDPSPAALARCRERVGHRPGCRLALLDDYTGEEADLTLSLDVVYHLVEDAAFEEHMRLLFDAARRHVIIYSSNHDAPAGPEAPHVRHRMFTRWVERERPQWQLLEHLPNPYPFRGDVHSGSFSDFHFFGRVPGAGP